MYLTSRAPFRSSGRWLNRSLVAMFLAITVLLLTRPVFAQSGDGPTAVKSSGLPAPATAPNAGESWDVFTPTFTNPALAPAPGEPAETELAPTSAGLVDPWMNQPIPPGPMLPSDMSPAPRGEFGGTRP